MSTLPQFFGGAGDPIGSVSFFPREITQTTITDPSGKEYIRSGTYVPYNSQKHSGLVGTQMCVSTDFFSDQSLNNVLVQNPVTGKTETWRVNEYIAGVGISTSASAELYKPVAKGEYQLVARFTQEDVASLFAGFQAGSINAASANYYNGVLNIIIRPDIAKGGFYCGISMYGSEGTSGSYVYDGMEYLMYSDNGEDWEVVNEYVIRQATNQNYHNNVAMGVYDGVCLFITNNSPSDNSRYVTYNRITRQKVMGYGGGTTATQCYRSIACDGEYFCVGVSKAATAGSVFCFPRDITRSVTNMTLTGMTSPYPGTSYVAVWYNLGKWVALRYDIGGAVVMSGPNITNMTARTTTGVAATDVSWSLFPCENGWILGGNVAIGSKSLFWSADGDTWTAIDNQTTTAYDSRISVFEEIGTNFVRQGTSLYQGFSVKTSTTTNPSTGGTTRSNTVRINSTTLVKVYSSSNSATALGYVFMLRSTDNGETWTIVSSFEVAAGTVVTTTWFIKYINGYVIIGGANGVVYYSSNQGASYSSITPSGLGAGNHLYDATYFNGKWYVVGAYANTYNYSYSSDFLSWTSAALNTVAIRGIANNDTTLVCHQDASTSTFWSTTGLAGSWTATANSFSTTGNNYIYYLNGQFIAMGYTASPNRVQFRTSATGQSTFTVVTQPTTGLWPAPPQANTGFQYPALTYYDSAYYLITNQGTVWKTTDLITTNLICAGSNSVGFNTLNDSIEVPGTYTVSAMIWPQSVPKYVGTKELIGVSNTIGYWRSS